MKDFFTKNKIIIIIALLIAESLFLRLFHLGDWLHFQLDQSRDSFLIKDVLQKGISELPLLGPRAGGSFLRLGPAYYYMMYFFARIASSVHPVVFVLPEIIGSIFFVPLFYLLLRRLFDWKWSFIITALAVNSTFLVIYDRFSWNPNLLPLFSILTIYAWLQYFDAKKEENSKSALVWVSLAALTAGIFTQLHFVVFVALPLILVSSTVIFWLRSFLFEKELFKKYTRNILKEIAVFAVVFAVTQAPIIANEYVSKGINTKEFFQTVSKKESKDASHKTSEKLVQNLWVYPKGYFITMTGNQGIDFPIWLFRPNLDIRCDSKCRNSFAMTSAAALFFLFSAILFIVLLKRKTSKMIILKKKISKSNKAVSQWEAFVFLAIWIIVPWWAFYSLSFTLRPRFFLFSLVPFWIITGLALRELAKNSLGKIAAYLAIIILLISNITNLTARFEIAKSASLEDKGKYPQDQILFQDESYPVTLNQEEAIAEWIKEKSSKDSSENYIFIWAPSFYYRPILYLLSNIETENKSFYFSHNPVWEKGNYFAVTRSTTPNDFFKGGKMEMFNTIDKKVIGTLTVYKLELTDKGRETARSRASKFTKGKEFSSEANTENRCNKKPSPSCRYTWGDL